VAAHLAAGVQLEELGDPFENPMLISIPVPQKTSDGWLGQVMQVDHFGNLVTNITSEQLKPDMRVNISVKDAIFHEVVSTFGSKAPGELIAMFDSSGHLAISVVNGSAADRLSITADEPIRLTFTSEQLL